MTKHLGDEDEATGYGWNDGYADAPEDNYELSDEDYVVQSYLDEYERTGYHELRPRLKISKYKVVVILMLMLLLGIVMARFLKTP